MARPVAFLYIDGREVVGASPCAVIEALRSGEPCAPEHLGRYLDLLHSRYAIAFGVDLDVGVSGTSLDARCHLALASLLRHGWLRVRPRPRVVWRSSGGLTRPAVPARAR
jgi:hypothetical protein